jgi:hypothetical protein
VTTPFPGVFRTKCDAPHSTYTLYDGNTYFVTHSDGSKKTHRILGSSNGWDFEKQLEAEGLEFIPRIALETHATYVNHVECRGGFTYGMYWVKGAKNVAAWEAAFQRLPKNANAFTYYGFKNWDESPSEEPSEEDSCVHLIIQVNVLGARSIHLFEDIASVDQYKAAHLEGHVDCTPQVM